MKNYLISFSNINNDTKSSREYSFRVNEYKLSRENAVHNLINDYKRKNNIKGETDSKSIKVKSIMKIVVGNLAQIGLDETLNLFKVDKDIVHISPECIKLLQSESISKIPIVVYYQKPRDKNGNFPTPEEKTVFPNQIEECSIDEAAKYLTLPKEIFNTIDLESFKLDS